MEKQKEHTNFYKIIMLIICVIILFVGSFFCCFSIFYPIKYKDIIFENCEKYEIDYALAFSIINAESKFLPNKTSSRGAIGLMQIMPSTAIFVADELGYENFSVESLYAPEINLQFGIYYLSYLFKKFDTLEQAICSYNAGESAVRGWLKNKKYSLDSKKLNVIPYPETRNYLSKVQKNMKIYKKIVQKV